MKSTSQTSTNLFAIDRPRDFDIEATRPHMRKHLRPWRLLLRDGGEVTINGNTPKDAMKRFKAMTNGEVGFVLAPAGGR